MHKVLKSGITYAALCGNFFSFFHRAFQETFMMNVCFLHVQEAATEASTLPA